MFSAKYVSRFLTAAALIVGLAAFAFADTVRLKDGSIIKGKIVSFSGGKFVMVIGQGERQREMTFFADEIESIEFDSAANSDRIPISVGGDSSSNPAFTEKTQGNETIITVGGARRDRPVPTDNGDAGAVDPNAVALDPAASTDDTVLDDPADDTLVINNDPVTDEPAAGGPPVLKDSTDPGPVQIRIKVFADDTTNGWTNSGWVVKKGQKIRIISNGTISLGDGRTTGPRGLATLPDPNKLIGDRPTGALIAVIGDDNNDFIFIGENREFVAQRDGALFLGVNEANLNDNEGTFDVIVEIEAGGD